MSQKKTRKFLSNFRSIKVKKSKPKQKQAVSSSSTRKRRANIKLIFKEKQEIKQPKINKCLDEYKKCIKPNKIKSY